MLKNKIRCKWLNLENPLYVKYHDEEWGVPVHNDLKLFEMLNLEGAQAGLSWETILKKREGYREAFEGFDPVRVSKMTESKVQQLLVNPAIVRHELKIRSVISNAKAFLEVQKEFGDFDTFIWSFVDGKPVRKTIRNLTDIPARTEVSDQMSKVLKKRGFKFVGSTICYAFMQAVGLVNDHSNDCFRLNQV